MFTSFSARLATAASTTLVAPATLTLAHFTGYFPHSGTDESAAKWNTTCGCSRTATSTNTEAEHLDIDLDKYARVRLKFGDGEIVLSARVTMRVGAEPTVAEPKSTVKATMVGNIPKSLVFDPRYLGEMLDHAGGETVTIAFSDSDRRDPVRVSSDDNPGPFGLLMAIIK